jgi:hypothetical protein
MSNSVWLKPADFLKSAIPAHIIRAVRISFGQAVSIPGGA